MKPSYVTRRLILLAGSASVAAIACGDDEGGTSTSTSSGGGSAGGSTATTTASSGGNGAGGSTTSAGGNAAGGNGTGGSAGACVGMMVSKGSNYTSDPHDVAVPLQDLIDGTDKTYESTGTGHTHDVTLTAADFATLNAGGTVKKYICLQNPNFTDHEFVFSCADPNIMPTFQGEIGTPNNCPG